MEDLSQLAENSLTVTSQAAGNMMSSNKQAMTAPGTVPVSPLPPQAEQDNPNVVPSNAAQIKPGTSGKPRPSHGPPGGSHTWTKTSTPDVVRET